MRKSSDNNCKSKVKIKVKCKTKFNFNSVHSSIGKTSAHIPRSPESF